MVQDNLIVVISNDMVQGKIIKKGPDMTLAKVLENSKLKATAQQLLSQMTNTNPSVNYATYDKKRKNKGGKPTQQQSTGKFHGSWIFAFKQQTKC